MQATNSGDSNAKPVVRFSFGRFEPRFVQLEAKPSVAILSMEWQTLGRYRVEDLFSVD